MDLRAALSPYVESGEVPGLVAVVARGDDVQVEVLGQQGPDGVAMRRDSLFRAASITKPLTAALAMGLVEDGLLDVDAPVSVLLPELASPQVLRTPTGPLDETVPCARPITARHLLGCTSGLGFTTVDSPVVPLLGERLHQGSMQVGDVPAPDVWLRRLAGIPLIHQPGEGWTYNLSYDLLGVLLARAAGASLADLMADRLLEPLGMVDTGFHVPAADVGRFTALLGRREGALVVTDPSHGAFVSPPAFASGAGGLVTTADDWLAFGRMLLADGGSLLSPASVRLLTTDHTTPQQREMAGFFLDGQGWGFGGGVDTSLREPWNEIGRYGWIGGTGTSAYVHPDRGTVAVLLTQVELGAPGIEDLLKTFWTAVV
ncbi:hypothetical protein ASC64_03650 [Nocardioides sp. Root122]|uniref:serine hydrolase domain-containing protein n=1 Tax=Nocardioides TaxID=1839 RepID=UPI0007030E7A|nr:MULTISPECIES: serine hydrolase domain-containing protein [Nocardioides]KQV77920.1 hypothetical protein ASC64_03650 [Nocardioides sp. Root122]MCK9822406.1 beta-lactamase family protein [Nocardioides cavernae]